MRSESVLELRRSLESRITFLVILVLLLAAGYVGFDADTDLAGARLPGTILVVIMAAAAAVAAFVTRRTTLDVAAGRLERRIVLAGIPVGPVRTASLRVAGFLGVLVLHEKTGQDRIG